MADILYQGHGSFRVITNSGYVLCIDPYAGEGYNVPADLILVTHQHPDHNQIDKPAKKDGCTVYQNADALAGGVYQTRSFGCVTVRAVEAYNKNHKKGDCVGFLLTVDGHLLYFAGDTSETQQMKELSSEAVEYAFLPCDGIFNMNVSEAVRCAEIIKAAHTVPVHMAPGKLFDEKAAKSFVTSSAYIMKPAEVLHLS